MFSKKIFFNTTLIALLSTPLISNASFETYNYTNEDSSVRITTGSYKPCSMDFGIYTPKQNPNGTPGYSSANDSQIKALCITSENNICRADIFKTKNCTGEKIGHAELNLSTYTITYVDRDDSRYDFRLENNGTRLNIKYSN